ncbi:MAG: hypothetical protein ABI824_04300 [Acidobacteriota bacterium]
MIDRPVHNSDEPVAESGGSKIPILFGAIVALVGASVFNFYQMSQLRADLSETRLLLASEIEQVHQTSSGSSKSSRAGIDNLRAELEAAKQVASKLAGQAKLDATHHADELAAKLELVQETQAAQAAEQTAKVAESVSAVSTEVSQVRQDASTNRERVGEVSKEVATVKNQADATRAELEKTIAGLSSAQGDLGVQSGLIATNGKQLAALRALGERSYTEFNLPKSKTTSRVGDLLIRLTKTDPKKNRYTIEVVADDKTMEKKDKTINEPVQFILSRSTLPFELVVNEVKKDAIRGYLAAPKVQQARGTN